jgi:hypothetical protein
MEEYLTITGVAARLKISPKTVKNKMGTQGFYNPVDCVKHSESLSVFIHCARTVPVEN